MTAISIASAMAGPALDFTFLTWLVLYKLLSLLGRFDSCRMQGLGNLWPKGYICLFDFICLLILFVYTTPCQFHKGFRGLLQLPQIMQ